MLRTMRADAGLGWLFVGAFADMMALSTAVMSGATPAQIAALFSMTDGNPIPADVLAASPNFPVPVGAGPLVEPLVLLGFDNLRDVTADRVQPGGDLVAAGIGAAYECCLTPVCFDGVRTV